MTQRTTHEPGSVTTQVADGVGSVTFGHPKGNSLPLGKAVATVDLVYESTVGS